MKWHPLDLSWKCYLSTEKILKYDSNCTGELRGSLTSGMLGEPDVSEGDEHGCAFWIFISLVYTSEGQHLIAGSPDGCPP